MTHQTRRGLQFEASCFVLGVVICLMLATAVVGRSSAAATGSAPAAQTAVAGGYAQAPDSDDHVERAQAPTSSTPMQAPAQTRMDTVNTRRGNPLSDYLASAVYPPWSRPLKQEQRDLIDWNRRHDPVTRSTQTPELRYRFSADRYWLTGGESALLSLKVWRGDVAVVPQAVSAWVTSPGHDAVNVEWRNDTGTATFSPAALLATEAATPLRVHVEFEVDGARRERAALNFNYTPAVAIPAKFTSGFEDDLVQGSLELHVGMDVFEPGHYLVDCNLYSADQPVAWARFKGFLDGGAATVTLKFFGRALFDAGRGGPYRIGELRGARYVEGQTPDLERVAPFEGTYVTRPYALSLLSNAEWDAPEKHAKIAALQRMGY